MNCMDILSKSGSAAVVFLHTVSDFLTWPVLALIGIMVFRKEVKALLLRTTEVGGILKAPLAKSQIASSEREPNELLARLTGPLVQERRQLIEEECKKQNVLSRDEFLLHHLAVALIFFEFERTYRLIFGSQLRLLQALNSTPSLESAEINTFYFLPAKQTQSDFYGNYTFDQWLAFLTDTGLVEGKESKVFITIKGKEFLKHLVQFSYPTEKPG